MINYLLHARFCTKWFFLLFYLSSYQAHEIAIISLFIIYIIQLNITIIVHCLSYNWNTKQLVTVPGSFGFSMCLDLWNIGQDAWLQQRKLWARNISLKKWNELWFILPLIFFLNEWINSVYFLKGMHSREGIKLG